jgi:hypothetical protein
VKLHVEEKRKEKGITNMKTNFNANIIYLDSDANGRKSFNEGMLINKSKKDVKKMKNIESLMNNGYEWDMDRNIGIKKTEDKISIKF